MKDDEWGGKNSKAPRVCEARHIPFDRSGGKRVPRYSLAETLSDGERRCPARGEIGPGLALPEETVGGVGEGPKGKGTLMAGPDLVFACRSDRSLMRPPQRQAGADRQLAQYRVTVIPTLHSESQAGRVRMRPCEARNERPVLSK